MKRMGFLPNALKLYAHRPEIAETLFRLNSDIMRDPSSTLDQFLKLTAPPLLPPGRTGLQPTARRIAARC